MRTLNTAMSAAENRVVYKIWSDGAATNDQLWSYDVGTGQSTKLAEIPLHSAAGFSRFQPSFSNSDPVWSYARHLPVADGS